MRDVRRPLVLVLSAATLLTVAGCEGSPPSVDTSNTEATVKGVVKIDGAPAKNGEIVFDPSNYKRKDAAPRSAPIGADGTYTIKTLTGANTVSVKGSVVRQNPVLSTATRSFEVSSGENTFDFEAKGGK